MTRRGRDWWSRGRGGGAPSRRGRRAGRTGRLCWCGCAGLVSEQGKQGVYVQEKGAFWLEVTFVDETALGSMPDQGENAIDRMAEFITRLAVLVPPELAAHPVLGRPTLNVGTISGGV